MTVKELIDLYNLPINLRTCSIIYNPAGINEIAIKVPLYYENIAEIDGEMQHFNNIVAELTLAIKCTVNNEDLLNIAEVRI